MLFWWDQHVSALLITIKMLLLVIVYQFNVTLDALVASPLYQQAVLPASQMLTFFKEDVSASKVTCKISLLVIVYRAVDV